MPRSARPRKAYRPRAVRVPPVFRYSEADESKLCLVPHVSLDAIRRGAGDDETWSTLTTRVNWGGVLAARHHPEAVPLMEAAQRALAAIHARHGRTGRWGAAGPELTALADALVVVDDMQRVHTRRELHDALRFVLQAQNQPARVGELMEVTP